jgi:hypothetical protein
MTAASHAPPLPVTRPRVRRPLPAPLRRSLLRLRDEPWLLTLGLSILVVLIARLGPDWPAQEFRAGLARHNGLTAWDDDWYGGHALPGYSLLYPVIAGALGASISGVLAATGCAWLVGRLLPAVDARRRRVCGLAFAVCVVGNLFLGQVPFLLGLLFGLAAMHVALRSGAAPRVRTRLLVLLFAAICSLFSPLAGFFLLLGGVAWAFEAGWRRALPLAGAVAGSGVSVLVGGGGGPFPFPWTGLVGTLVFTASTLLLVPRRNTLLRRFVVIYALVALGSFAVPNPVGGNLVRIGPLIAVPSAVWMLQRRSVRRIAVVALGLVPALAWQFYPIGSAAARAAGDPSVSASYYTGLLGFLSTQDPANGRLEIPFTREHWEAAMVAPNFPIARGWERQTDLQYDSVLYAPLTAASYRTWLASAGVDLVALPDAPLDYGGKAEQTLLAHPPSYLHLVWSDKDWKVWRVAGAQPLVSGPATLTKLGTSSFDLDFSAPGVATVRLRQSSLWSVTDGAGCVLPDQSDGWVHVKATAAGLVTTRARVSLSSILPSGTASC